MLETAPPPKTPFCMAGRRQRLCAAGEAIGLLLLFAAGFACDPQAGLPAGALESGVFLRLPGQLDDETWRDATIGVKVYYNGNRVAPCWSAMRPRSGERL